MKHDESIRIFDVFYLAFWVGAKPADLYLLRLHEHPKSNWLKFVFRQEVRHWHSVQAPSRSRTQANQLSDKQAFSQKLRLNGIHAVAEIDVFEQGEIITQSRVFRNQSCFIKPSALNAMRGCMSLERTANGYRLLGRGLNSEIVDESDRESIFEVIQSMVNLHAVLMQPLLENDRELSLLDSNKIQTQTLSIIRVVTTLDQQLDVSVESAVLELRTHDVDKWMALSVDVNNGRLAAKELVCADQMDVLQPFWHSIVEMLSKAHALFDQIPAIAWDTAITREGPTIIEGNWGWNLMYIQQVLLAPVLSDNLLNIYASQSSRE